MPTETVTTAVSPTSGTIGVDFTSVATTPEHVLGQVEPASDGNTYIYVRANGTVAQYDACLLDEVFDAAPCTTTLSGAKPQAAVFPQVAIADNSYGWAVLKGISFEVNVLASCAADVKLYTTATAGSLDDTATDLVQGLVATEADGGSGGNVTCSAPNGAYVNAQD